jgi:hypothetical protein
VKDLLPVPPVSKKVQPAALAHSLAEVPEVDFQTPLAKELPSEESLKRTAHTIAKINHLNGKQNDGFLEALRGQRTDLAGLPFAMGDACRTTGDRSRQLTHAVNTVRSALRQQGQPVPVAILNDSSPQRFTRRVVQPGQEMSIPSPPPVQPDAPPPVPVQTAEVVVQQAPTITFTSVVSHDRAAPQAFWEQYAAACAQEDKQVAPADRSQLENIAIARIAALMQILAPEAPSMRLGLVKYLAAVSHVEATRALARLAVFSEEDEVRQAAVAALKVRRERDYTDILVAALRYPWPAVAQRSADALAKLERTDLLPQFVAMLDASDPRAPVRKASGDGQEVRELVRINHHRNCLLCHAPGNTAGVAPETLTAGVPVPSDPLPSQPDGYQTISPDILVRIDVTYLRPDFSAFQPVADANPWPEMQRFDYLVRTRSLTEADAAALRQKLTTGEPGRPSAYQRAALAALRELTGRDAAPTAEAWRRLLNLPAEAKATAP